MKGFKDTTRTHYSKGGPACGPKGAAKTSQVMSEFKGPVKKAAGGMIAQRMAAAAPAAKVAMAKAAANRGPIANRVQGALSRLPRQ